MSKYYSSEPAKYMAGFFIVLFIRLISWGVPNVEPLMATLMPVSKRYGAVSAFSFAFFSMTVFDALTGKLGVWTLLTAMTYGFIGMMSALHFGESARSGTVKEYLLFAIQWTLIYDLFTGVFFGAMFFGQPLWQAFTGQIPFTLLHLAGTSAFVLLLTPLIEHILAMQAEAAPEFVEMRD